MAGVRLEVRCCCQPQKLLGWLTVPDARRKSVAFRLSQRVYRLVGHRLVGHAASIEPRTVVLPIEQINYEVAGVEVSYRAIKAEGAPLELLRRIPQFEEA